MYTHYLTGDYKDEEDEALIIPIRDLQKLTLNEKHEPVHGTGIFSQF